FRNVSGTVTPNELHVDAKGGDLEVIEATGTASGAAHIKATLAGEGLCRLTVEDPTSGLRGESNPIRCGAEPQKRVYWGDFHVHCNFSDGVRTIEHLYDYGEHIAGLDVCGASDHSPMMSDTMWARNVEFVKERYRSGQFVTLLGFEWATPGTGHRCVYSRDDRLALERVRSLAELRQNLDRQRAEGREVLVIPHHMLTSTAQYAPERPDTERLMEVYSQWGNSEVRGNPKRPLSHWDPETKDRGRSAQEILLADGRLGMIGGSDNHDARPGMTGAGAYDIVGLRVRSIYRTLGHPGGLAGIYAPELTREAIFDGLAARQCYATTGERILLEFAVDGALMGTEVQAQKTQAPRTITAWVAGTAPLARLVVLRNAEEVYELTPDGDTGEVSLSWEDESALDAPATFYYLRVEQTDGEMAWSSPVWFARE
ncbi:MAG TPA: CehA/McbA family metallohydrolase, partial [Chloroflexota bacterium]|nr:CehA/McbA family metallohydrolase [Chloroflexota bacterium]